MIFAISQVSYWNSLPFLQKGIVPSASGLLPGTGMNPCKYSECRGGRAFFSPYAASASGKGLGVGTGAPPLHSLLQEAGDSSDFQLSVSLHVGGHFLAQIILISSCLAGSALANLFFGILYAFVKMSKGMYKALEWRLNLHSGVSSGYEILEILFGIEVTVLGK